MKRSFIFVISLIMAFVIQAQETNQIDTIGFEGLKRCKRSFLLNCTQCEKGSVYDSAMIAHDIQHIKNTTLFTDVDCRVEERPDGRYLIYELKEKWTLIPSFKAGVSQDRYWFQFGAVDFHFMGSGINLAVFYKYFDRSSFFGHVITPYINRTKWGEAIAFEYLKSIEPIFIDDNLLVDFDQQRMNIEILGSREFKFKNSFLFGLAYLSDSYRFLSTDDDGENFSFLNEDQEKYLLILRNINHAHLNYDNQNQFGWSNELKTEISLKGQNGRSYWKIENEFKLFKLLSKRGNFALRLRAGVSENDESPFAPFIHDSFETVRGAGNKSDRGNSEITLNLEYRYTFYENRLIAAQAVVFNDASSLGQPGEKMSSIFDSKNFIDYSGAGVRLYFKTIASTTIRLDYAVSLKDSNGAYVFGIGQYF